jgi:hypothetical protein
MGVELCGTGEFPFAGTLGASEHPFEIAVDNGKKNAVFVKSAIEALCLLELNGDEIGVISSMSGGNQKFHKKRADAYRSQGYKIVAALNNNEAGEVQAAYLGKSTIRWRPTGPDWSDDLLALKNSESNLEYDAEFYYSESERERQH